MLPRTIIDTQEWIVEPEPDGRYRARRGTDRLYFDTQQQAERHVKMAERQSAISEYEQKIRDNMLKPARAIIVGMTETDLLSAANGIPQQVAATASDDDFVGDSTLTKRRAERISEVATAFRVWLNEPMASGALPLVVLSERD